MKVYVARDYDAITYAGTMLAAAKLKCRGDSIIQVWQNGQLIGWWTVHSVAPTWRFVAV
jgi:hypothetical protein